MYGFCFIKDNTSNNILYYFIIEKKNAFSPNCLEISVFMFFYNVFTMSTKSEQLNKPWFLMHWSGVLVNFKNHCTNASETSGKNNFLQLL